MVRPIPKRLLIHSIKYEEYTGDDGWDVSFADPITIDNVRVNQVSKLNRSNDSEGEQVNHVVFIDRKNSSHFPTFKIRSQITFNDITREVVDVKPYYAFDSEPHFYEIELK